MEWEIECDNCGKFNQFQKNDPVLCPKCQSPNIDTSNCDKIMRNTLDATFRDGQTVQTDHITTTFAVSVRALRPVSEETIKNLIETRFEVVSIEETNQSIIATKLN